jgi:uncharacterized repeat protein (TIGR03803 family)
MIDVNGTLYGTTYGGGMYGKGTVFRITARGKEKVLHSFGAGSADGQQPEAALVEAKGSLYGTTLFGGAYDGGILFSVSTSGREKVLHTFGASKDGFQPYAPLIDVAGTLYGTTSGGGTTGNGTVFSATTSGKERVLHNFRASNDGHFPQAALLDVKGTLYGTTPQGGLNGENGGVLFSVTAAGNEKVVYGFPPITGAGYTPTAGVIEIKPKLYGTTSQGGTHGSGTVFVLTPCDYVNLARPRNGFASAWLRRFLSD